jgi:general secretion pathway protein G
MKKCPQSSAGFTLLELLAVITIIGILAATVMSRISTQAFDAKKKCCLQYKADLNSAIERFHFEQDGYPSQLSELQGTYYPESIPNCPVTNLPYEIDSVTNRVQGHIH